MVAIIYHITLCFMVVIHPKPSEARYLRSDTLSPMCHLNTIGYKPTERKVEVGQVQAPVATSQTNYVKTFAGKGTLIANGGMHTSNVVNGLQIYKNSGFKAVRNFAKYAPVFASSLGVLGVVFGIIVDASTPSMAELMERTNQLFENFAKEVNLRLEQLKGYVDAELITLEKRLMMEDYQDLASTWTNCGEFYKDDISICLKLAMIKILSQSEKFLKNEEELLKADSGSALPERDVRVMEANFPTFANYVFLALTNLDILASTYEDQTEVLRQHNPTALQNFQFDETKKHYFRMYAEKFVNMTSRFKTYQQKAVAQFKKLHTKNKCEDTTVCITVQEQSTAYRNSRKKENVYKCSCQFDPTLVSNMAFTCKQSQCDQS